VTIAVIPARGGSKRIPRKNIRLFAGRPMIAYAVAAARESGLFEHVIVSTDDPEIADIARFEGAETPFVRPVELADDHVPTVPVVAHAIRACADMGWKVNRVCCIYACVPFIELNDLSGALALFEHSGADFCFPVTEYPSPVQRALVLGDEGQITPFFPEFELARTQDLKAAYHDAGQFYWGRADAWLNKTRIHSNGVGYPIPQWRSVDIDTEDDWARAQSIFQYISKLKQHD
jgi:pseudaminic acid cytidylyltransferase